MESECLQEGTCSAWITAVKQRDSEVLCGCIVSSDKWQGKPCRGLKQNSSTCSSFMASGRIVSQQKTLPHSHFTDCIKYSKLLVK